MAPSLEICHALDPVAFARERLGFQPDPKQALVLSSRSKRVILNCSRQWGKSTLTAAQAVFTAWHEPESLILVMSPTERQSGELVRKAASVPLSPRHQAPRRWREQDLAPAAQSVPHRRPPRHYRPPADLGLAGLVAAEIGSRMTPWHLRALPPTYHALVFDGVVVRSRDGSVASTPVRSAVGVTASGDASCWRCAPRLL